MSGKAMQDHGKDIIAESSLYGYSLRSQHLIRNLPEAQQLSVEVHGADDAPVDVSFILSGYKKRASSFCATELHDSQPNRPVAG